MGKGAILDVDGTLLDSMPIWENSSARFLAGLGIEAEKGLNDIMFRLSLDEGSAYLKKAYRLDLSEQEVKEGAREFLEQLKKRDFSMYIATSSNREHIRAAFERLGMYDYFDGLITCEEAGASKRDPRIFLISAERMGLAPEDVFVFEDVIHAIRSAGSAGFVTVGVYDEASDADNEAMRAESSIYLHSLKNWDQFREAAGLKR